MAAPLPTGWGTASAAGVTTPQQQSDPGIGAASTPLTPAGGQQRYPASVSFAPSTPAASSTGGGGGGLSFGGGGMLSTPPAGGGGNPLFRNAGSTPGAAIGGRNQLLRNAGSTPGPGSGGGGFGLGATGFGSPPPVTGPMGSVGAKSLLSPSPRVGGGVVTFADDTSCGRGGGGFGLRQRKGASVASAGARPDGAGAENDMNVRNMPSSEGGASMPPPPKASLMLIPSGRYGDLKEDGQARAASERGSASATPDTAVGRTTPASAAPVPSVDKYANWALVYGFTTPAQRDSVIRRFETYGTILRVHEAAGNHSGGKSNWVALRYETRLQAEKALCQHDTLLDGGVAGGGGGSWSESIIIGVMRVDSNVVRWVGFDGTASGSATMNASSQNGHPMQGDRMRQSPRAGGSGRGGDDRGVPLEEEDVLVGMGGTRCTTRQGLVPRTGGESEDGDFCDKVLAWLFTW